MAKGGIKPLKIDKYVQLCSFRIFLAENSCVLVTDDSFCLCVKNQSCARYEAIVVTEYI